MIVLKETLFPSVEMLASFIASDDEGRTQKVKIKDDGRYIKLVAECDIIATAPKSPIHYNDILEDVTVNLYQFYITTQQCEEEIDLSIVDGNLVIKSYQDPKDETKFDMEVTLGSVGSFDEINDDIIIGKITLEPLHFTAIFKELYNFPTESGVWFQSTSEGTFVIASDRGVSTHLEIKGLNQIKFDFKTLYIPFKILNLAFSVSGGVMMGGVDIRIGVKSIAVVNEKYEIRAPRQDIELPSINFPDKPTKWFTFDAQTLVFELELVKNLHKYSSDMEYIIRSDSEQDIVYLEAISGDEQMPIKSRIGLGASVDEDEVIEYDPFLLFDLISNPGVTYMQFGLVDGSLAIYYKSDLFLKKIIYNHDEWIASKPK